MTRSESPDFDTAVVQLCSMEWAPSGTHVATRHSDDVLKALLPASRTDEGRVALGASPGAIENLVCVLRDPLVFHEPLGELAIRLLRNLCARSAANQTRAAQCGAHELVIDCIAKRFEFCDVEGSGAEALAIRRMEDEEDEDHHRMRLPFFGFAVEFLVNFATCNPLNAELVWNGAFPDVLEKLLRCNNHAAASAAAALVHNCIAVVPDRLTDVVKIWSGKGGNNKSLTQSLIQQMKRQGNGDEAVEEKFSWSFMIIRRLIGASLLQRCFEALGPPLEQAISSLHDSFSEDQQILLQVLEASVSKSAESEQDDDNFGIQFPPESIYFLGELLEAGFLKRDGDVLRTTGSIVGSAILISEDSESLDDLRTRTVKVAIHVLRAMSGQEGAGKSGEQKSRENISFKGDVSRSGLRGVMMRAIAISCDLCKKAQDAVRNLQGIPFVLNALSYEKDVAVNPFLREWAILAVRNLTLENPENAQEISSYELQGVQNDTELLEKTGLEAFMDPESGRPRLRVKKKSPE